MLLFLYHENRFNPFGFDYVPLATFRFKLSLHQKKMTLQNFLPIIEHYIAYFARNLAISTIVRLLNFAFTILQKILHSYPLSMLRKFKAGCRTVLNNGSGSGLAPAQNILAVQVHSSKILLVQVRFGFIDLKLNCRYSFRPEKKEKLLILLMITTALIVRVPAPAASGYGKIYSYFC